MQTFSGPVEVQLYRALALKRGLLLYSDTGIKPNSRWTPTAMLKAASGITGKPYKRGEYHKAARDLEEWAMEQSHDRS